MLTGTEADIINCVARLRRATKAQVRKEVGFSLEYIGFLCCSLVRKGFLKFAQGYYCLAEERLNTLLSDGTPQIDRELLKNVAGELAKEIGSELKKTVKGIKIPVSVNEPKETEKEAKEKVRIRTDFDFPVEDESLILESNIDKIGVNLGKEKSDIENKVELLKKFQRGGRND